MKPFASTILTLIIIILLVSCAGNENPTTSNDVTRPAPTTTTSPSAVEAANASGLYPADINWDAVVDAFSYGIGAKSWESAYDLNADAFIMHYLYLASVGEITIDRSGPADQHGHALIPRDELERIIPNRFYVPAEYLRTSQYYSAETKSYCAIDIGPVLDTVITEIMKTEYGAIIHFQQASEQGESFDCVTEIAIFPTALSYRYQYVSFQTTHPAQESDDSGTVSLTGDDALIPGTDIDSTQIAQAFCYQIGAQPWDTTLAIDPDALVVHYIYLGITPGSGVVIDRTGPVDDQHGNPLMPREGLETVIMQYFDVPAAHIRQSQYYDPATESYWTGGIGSVDNTAVTAITKTETGAVIHTRNIITSRNYYDSWEAEIEIAIAPDGTYHYISYNHNRSTKT